MKLINEAIHKTASGYEGGVRKLARDLNLQPGTLSNKCNPSMQSHVLNIKELIDICKQTDDLTPLFEIARNLHCVCVPIETHKGISDMQLLDAWSDWDIEQANTKKEIKNVLDLPQITTLHLDRIEQEMFEDFQKALALLGRLRAMSA